MQRFTKIEVFPSLIGITYILDSDFNIIDYQKKNWDKFASENNGKELVAEKNVLNKNILDSIAGDAKKLYRKAYTSILGNKNRKIIIPYNCDSDDMIRNCILLLSYQNIDSTEKSDIHGILCQSLVLKETLRPPMKIFAEQSKRYISDLVETPDKQPIIITCSYCKNILNEKTSKWEDAMTYYQNGGSDDVLLSHGVCESCSKIVMEQIDLFEVES